MKELEKSKFMKEIATQIDNIDTEYKSIANLQVNDIKSNCAKGVMEGIITIEEYAYIKMALDFAMNIIF